MKNERIIDQWLELVDIPLDVVGSSQDKHWDVQHAGELIAQRINQLPHADVCKILEHAVWAHNNAYDDSLKLADVIGEIEQIIDRSSDTRKTVYGVGDALIGDEEDDLDIAEDKIEDDLGDPLQRMDALIRALTTI